MLGTMFTRKPTPQSPNRNFNKHRCQRHITTPSFNFISTGGVATSEEVSPTTLLSPCPLSLSKPHLRPTFPSPKMAQSLHLLTPPTSFSLRRPVLSIRHPALSPSSSTRIRTAQLRIRAASDVGGTMKVTPSGNDGVLMSTGIDVDAVTEAELRENGFRSTRRTKLVCTIGPATCGVDQIEALAVGGMNVARVNMCHGDHEWHREVIRRVRRLNEEKGFAVAVMMDTEGSEIHMGDLPASSAKAEVQCL